MINLCIQGLGFVGSAMSVAASSRLDKNNKPIFNVVGIDRQDVEGLKRIKKNNSGSFPFLTDDKILKSELARAVERGDLSVTADIKNYSKANIVIVSINCDLVKLDGLEKIAFSP